MRRSDLWLRRRFRFRFSGRRRFSDGLRFRRVDWLDGGLWLENSLSEVFDNGVLFSRRYGLYQLDCWRGGCKRK
jgi:hypothetical protein